jgi:hypothetical protein
MSTRVDRYGVSDYILKINDGGNITFDNGSGGSFTITGDLNVLGETTTIEATELVIEDPIITLNKNDADVDLMGLEFGRSTNSGKNGIRAQFTYNEDLPTYYGLGVDSRPDYGAFELHLVDGTLTGLHVKSLNSGESLVDNPSASASNLNLLYGQPAGSYVQIGSANYSESLWERDPIFPQYIAEGTNVDGMVQPDSTEAVVTTQTLIDYVTSFNQYNYSDRIQSGLNSLTQVITYDDEDQDGNIISPAVTPRVEVRVNGAGVATFYEVGTGSFIEGISMIGDVLSTSTIGSDLILRGNGLGSVQVDGWQNYTLQLDPSTPTEGVTVYSKALGDGGTGLYFVNEDGTTDEFVSRNKALLYSIIF